MEKDNPIDEIGRFMLEHQPCITFADDLTPTVGMVFEHEGVKYAVAKVKQTTPMQVLSSGVPDLEGCDDLLVLPHPTRPGVIWTVWVKKV